MNDENIGLKPVFLFYEIGGELIPVCAKCKKVLNINTYKSHKCEDKAFKMTVTNKLPENVRLMITDGPILETATLIYRLKGEKAMIEYVKQNADRIAISKKPEEKELYEDPKHFSVSLVCPDCERGFAFPKDKYSQSNVLTCPHCGLEDDKESFGEVK